MATATVQPSLPLSGQRFSLYEDRPSEIIVSSLWLRREPDENDIYTVHVLTLDDSTPELPDYGVVRLGWSDEEHFWAVLEEQRFDSIEQAAAHYGASSGA